jgi:hypothetical protein
MQNTKIDWLSHVGAIKAQAGSTAAYARQHHLARATLYYWQRKLKALALAQAPAEPVSMEPLLVPAAPSASPVVPKSPSKFVALRVSMPECVVPPVVTTTPPALTPCTLVLTSGLRPRRFVIPLGCPIEQAYLYRDPIDFRKAINALCVLVEQALGLSPYASVLYVLPTAGATASRCCTGTTMAFVYGKSTWGVTSLPGHWRPTRSSKASVCRSLAGCLKALIWRKTDPIKYCILPVFHRRNG